MRVRESNNMNIQQAQWHTFKEAQLNFNDNKISLLHYRSIIPILH